MKEGKSKIRRGVEVDLVFIACILKSLKVIAVGVRYCVHPVTCYQEIAHWFAVGCSASISRDAGNREGKPLLAGVKQGPALTCGTRSRRESGARAFDFRNETLAADESGLNR